MNWTGAVRTIVVCAILIVLHYTLRPLLAWRASIDFLIVALLLGSVRLRPGAAAMYGFFLGLVADSLAVSGVRRGRARHVGRRVRRVVAQGGILR